MCTSANSEDLDEMPHRGLYCLLGQNRSSRRKSDKNFGNLACDPSVYTMDHLDFIVYSLMKSPFV